MVYRCLLNGAEAIVGEGLLVGWGAEPVEEGMRIAAVEGFTQDNSAQTDIPIGGRWHKDERAELFHVRCGSCYLRYESKLRLAGLDELSGLSEVLGDDEVGIELVV